MKAETNNSDKEAAFHKRRNMFLQDELLQESEFEQDRHSNYLKLLDSETLPKY